MKTQIYAFDLTGEAFLYAEIKNGEEGAPLIWKYFYEKYINKINKIKTENVPQVLNLITDERLKDEEKLILCSTVDWMIIKKEMFIPFAEAFEKVVLSENIKIQSEMLRFAFEDKNVSAIGWNQNSKRERNWQKNPFRKSKNEKGPYNYKKENTHLELTQKKKEQ